MKPDGYRFKKGDVVKWVGPPWPVCGVVVTRPNDLWTVLDVRPGVLTLKGNGRVFGWVDDRNVEKVENLVAV